MKKIKDKMFRRRLNRQKKVWSTELKIEANRKIKKCVKIYVLKTNKKCCFKKTKAYFFRFPDKYLMLLFGMDIYEKTKLFKRQHEQINLMIKAIREASITDSNVDADCI